MVGTESAASMDDADHRVVANTWGIVSQPRSAIMTHPFTAKHLTVVCKELGYHEISPVSKTLACGDSGLYTYYY